MTDTRLYLDDAGTPRIRRARDATLWTGINCSECGKLVFARNKKAQEAIIRAADMGVEVKCHRCGG